MTRCAVRRMYDLPAISLFVVMLAYWGRVAAMSWRIRRRTRTLSGVVPEQPLERMLWWFFVPVVALWIALPLLAGLRPDGGAALPAAVREGPWLALRWCAVVAAAGLLVATIRCWKRMGRHWKMAVTPGERQVLITDGPFERVRHPIYGYQILLMLASLAVVPTVPMLVVAVFVGASYFRAVGQHMNYGLSARGLAIDTVLASGEEFPYFRKFWIHEPQPDAKDISLYALLDSPSVAGAYHFVIRPGKETLIDVELTLFLRKPVLKLGIAPMTSMFHHGENSYAKVMDDFRPEIHDSDGLMIATASGEWIWRPLVNPKTLFVNSFQVNNPVGFGLSQRDLDFDHYQDLESNYENRPSLWISPVGNWGEGRVELIQIPTDKEIYDNIVAFFVPSKLPEQGQPLSFAYRMVWHYGTESPRPPAGRVVATRAARTKVEGARKFIIDFAGTQLDSLAADKPVEGVVTVGSGAKFMEQQVYKNRFTGGWRLVFQILAKTKDPVELRAFLKLGDNVLTETWSYAYEP